MEEKFDKAHFIEIVEALHHDQTGLAEALVKLQAVANGYQWLAEGGQGSYEWDDDYLRKEIGYCLDAIRETIDAALTKTSQAHQICCGKYGHVHRLPCIPTQRRLRLGQINYENFADDIMDLALIDGAIC